MHKKQFTLLIISFIFLFMILSFNFVSANGLFIAPNIISVNKTVGVNYITNINITNQEPITFYNITLSDNTNLHMITISQLNSGESITTSLNITSDNAINSIVRVRGLYNSNVGQQNLNHVVNITSLDPGSINPCDISIVKGDSVTWWNSAFSSLTMKTLPDNIPVDGGIILRDASFTKQFPNDGTFKYSFFIGAFQLPSTCTITILNSTGLINDPALDGAFNLIINPSYTPTTISTNIVNNNFTVSVLESQDGVMSVTNTGSNIAKGVHLSGDWLSFNTNDFDLNPGVTKGIVFSISPIISNSSNTNQTYTKSLSISGNFDSISIPLTIYVPYTNIASGGNINSTEDLDTLLRGFCLRNPAICQPVIVVQGGNGSEATSTFNITESQWQQFWTTIYEEQEARTTFQKSVSDTLTDVQTKVTNSTDASNKAQQTAEENKQTYEDTYKQLILLLVVVLLIVCCVIIVFLIKARLKKNKEDKLRR